VGSVPRRGRDPSSNVTDGHELYWSDETGPEGGTLHERLERMSGGAGDDDAA
jgi:hypothetical protein